MDINEREHIVTEIKKCDKEIRDINIGIVISVVIALYTSINSLRVSNTSQWVHAIRFFAICFLIVCTADIMNSASRKNKIKQKKRDLNESLKILKLKRNGILREYDPIEYYSDSEEKIR